MAWRGYVALGTDIVVKLYTGVSRNPLFPNDAAAEARILRFLQEQRLTPTFRASFGTAAGRCNVYDHIPGQPWQRDTSVVANMMRRLHATPPPDGMRRVADGSAALRAQTEAILSLCHSPPDVSAAFGLADCPATGQQSLLHTDIVPGNLIENGAEIHLIDWQCPAVGDPCEDIAVFVSPAMQMLYRGAPLTPQDVAAFFTSYAQAEVHARYHHLAPLYHARMAAYCQWQVEQGQPDYRAAGVLELAALQRSLRA